MLVLRAAFFSCLTVASHYSLIMYFSYGTVSSATQSWLRFFLLFFLETALPTLGLGFDEDTLGMNEPVDIY